MSVIRKVQNSFNGGEYSPNIFSRTDIDSYQKGLRRCRNFLVHAHGGISNRPGTYFVASSKNANKKCRVVPFVFSLDQAYTLEFGEGYIRFYTDGAQIQSGISAYEIVTPYQEADLKYLRIESSADTIYISSPYYQTRVLSRLGNTNWTIELFEPEDGPFMLENITDNTLSVSSVTGSAISMSAATATFFPLHVGSLWRLRHYIEGQTVSTTFTSATTSASIKCFTTWRIITHGTWTGKFNVEKSIDGGATWTILRTFSSSNDFNADTSGTEDIETTEEPFLIRINFYSYTSGSANIDLTSDPFNQEGIAKVLTYNNATSVTVNILSDFGLTTGTTMWAEGSWSNYRGWPRVVRFCQDRLCFGGTSSEPMTNWLSKTGNYKKFGRNSLSLLDSDGISLSLPTRQLNAVNGLIVLQRLIAFTAASEWTIGPTDGSPITPNSAPQNIQGYHGSSGIDPVVIGNQAIFVQSRGTVVRNIGFQLQEDGFTGTELNILSKHLFEGHSIVEMAYQQEPDRILWCLRDDGILLALTYMPEQEVVAWSWHDTEGEIESICVIPADGYDELWMSVSRGTGRYIERMAHRMTSTEPKNQYFVDCGITYDVPVAITNVSIFPPITQGGFLSSGFLSENEPFLEGVQIRPIEITAPSHAFSNNDVVDISDILGTTELNGNRYIVSDITTDTFRLIKENNTEGQYEDGTGFSAYISGGYVRKAFSVFTGLSHLIGKTVSILGNGEVYPQQVVSGSGQITLSKLCSTIHIGYPYMSDMETLNVEIGTKYGTLQGQFAKINNITFRLINSKGGWIGPSEDSLKESFTPNRLSLGNAPALFSGDIRVPLGAGYEQGARIFYRQYDPLPVTISSVIPEVTI